MRNLLRAATFLLATALLTGCASSRIASTWKDAQDSGAPVKKLIVFVVAKDPAVRGFAENQAVHSLPAGTAGVASHTLFEQAAPDMQKLRARLEQEGFDGALVSRLVSVDKTRIYHPPQVQYLPDPWPSYRSFYWYYPWVYSYAMPGYTTEQTKVIVETMLYRLPDGRSVWSAVSETVNPDSTLALVDELIRILGRALRDEGLIAQR